MFFKPRIKLLSERRKNNTRAEFLERPLAAGDQPIPPWQYKNEIPLTPLQGFLVKVGVLPRQLYVWLNVNYPTFARSATFPDQWFYYGRQSDYQIAVTHCVDPEIIVGVASWEMSTGMLWVALRPYRHHHLYSYTWEYGSNGAEQSYHTQGFITNHGRFLDRFAAFKLAHENGQYARVDNSMSRQELYSEDLWTSESQR